MSGLLTIALLFVGFVALLTLAVKVFAVLLGRSTGARIRHCHETAEYILATGKIPPEWLAATRLDRGWLSWSPKEPRQQSVQERMEQLIRHFEKSPLVSDEPTRQLLLEQLRAARCCWADEEPETGGTPMKTALVAGLFLLTACVPGEMPEAPAPKVTDDAEVFGEYVDDPHSGSFYNLDDYGGITGRSVTAFAEAPGLAARVAAGTLPAVAERLPDNPLVVVPWENIGSYGGTLRYSAAGFVGDTYLRYFNESPLLEVKAEPGTSPIVKYINTTLQPGVLEYWEQDDEARRFTFRIRRGLRWSDGAPVTTEDVRFCIEEIVLNEELYPVAQEWSMWGGTAVRLEVVDRYTFRFEFADSYGVFLQRLAQWRWWWFMLPSHYLKPQHRKYVPVETLLPAMREQGYESADDWGRWYNEVHARRWGVEEFVPGKVPNVEQYPTLDPWLHVSQPNPGDLLMERNPYYFKIDPDGNQLPYIDRLTRTYVADVQMKNMKIISGETDLQFQWMRLSDFPLLKRNEEAGDYRAVILRTDQENRVIYPFNFSTRDSVWNRIIGDVRFRQALSLAINREEMNDVLWLGAGRPAQLTAARGSPWYDVSYEQAYADFDLERAHQLLDEMGLSWDEDRRFRLRPDGDRLTLILHYPSEYTEWGNGAEMAEEYWSALGIEVIVKASGLLDQLRAANEHQAIVWCGNGAVPTDTSFICGFSHTPPWHMWVGTNGEEGLEPPPWAREVLDRCDEMFAAPTAARRDAAANEVFRLLAQHLYVLSAVTEAPVPFIFSRRLGNISVAEPRGYYETTAASGAEQFFFRGG